MSLRRNLLVLMLCLLPGVRLGAQELPAFPGAEGFGAWATGGRGGDVYIVTNLDASGPGSFAQGITTAPAGGRTIVFEVSGHIRLPSGSGGGLSINGNRITVAGQTAPGDGICFWNNTMNLNGDDLVLRHLRWRYGYQAAGGDAVDVGTVSDLMIDHCDVMFSTDENLSSFGSPPARFTFQWSNNAWGLSGHSAGGLWNMNHATTHHTLWSNNHTRNPKLIGPTCFDWVNNVVFGWDNGFNLANTGLNEDTYRVNVRGSWFIHGGSTTEAIYGGGPSPTGANKFNLHMADTALDGNANGVLDASRTNYGMVTATSYNQTPTAWAQTSLGNPANPVIGVPVTVDSRTLAYKKVVSQGGPLRMGLDPAHPLRDEITQKLMDELVAQDRNIIANPASLGLSTGTGQARLDTQPAPTDTDRDGMPDFWENALGGNPAAASHNLVFTAPQLAASFFPAGTPAGYTHLEEYLHFKASPHGVVTRNTLGGPTSLSTDLRKFTSGFSASPVFTLSAVSGGTAVQSGPGGALVTFTPTVDFFGRAGFDFTVTDAAGDAWTQRALILVTAVGIPRDLVWSGNGTTNPWDTTTSVWRQNGAAATFGDGSNVVIDDSGSNAPPITLAANRQPGTVLVDNTAKDFTLLGPGVITGAASLTKRGTGALILRANHNYTGPTVVEQGALVLGLPGTAANSTGDIGSSPLTLRGGATLRNAWIGTSHQILSPITVPAGETAFLQTSRSIDLRGALTGGGALTIVNQGTAGGVDFSGPMAAFAGELNFEYAGSNGGMRAWFNGRAFDGWTNARVDLGDGNRVNPQTNSGGNTFNIGALSGGAASALNGGTSGAPHYTVGALNLDTAFAGSISGNARLTKTGTGRLTLSGTGTHTGTTAVNQGTLAVDGSLTVSPVTVAAGARLAGAGNLGGTVTVAAGGMVAPGAKGGDDAGTLTLGGATLASPVYEMDLSSSPAGANDRVVTAPGEVFLSGVQTFQIRLRDGILNAGVYNLVTSTNRQHASGVSFAHNLPATPRQSYAFSRNASGSAPGFIRLTVTGSPATLDWTGSAADWDINTSTAWLRAGTPDVFHNLDAVRFTDAASGGSVTLATNVAPRAVEVNNSAARPYTWSGAGLAGGAVLTKNGAGTFTLNAANQHTGGLTLNAGLVQLGSAAANAGALGTGVVTLNGGQLNLFSAGNGTHAGTFPNPLHVAGAGTFQVPPRGGISSRVTGAGTLNYVTNYVRADVSGDWSGFTGTLSVRTAGAGDYRVTADYAWPGLPQARVDLAANTYFYHTGILSSGAGTLIEIGGLSGTAGSHLRGGVTGGRTLTYRVGGRGGNETFAGDFTEQNTATSTRLLKAGAGVWTLAGPCTHAGETVVEAGTLCVAATGSIRNESPLTVLPGAALCLDGGAIGAESVNLQSGATLTSTGGSIAGEIFLNGDLNLTAGTLVLDGPVVNSGTLRVSGLARLNTTGSFRNTGVLDLLSSAGGLPAGLVNEGVVIANTERRILRAEKAPAQVTVTVMGHAGHTYQLETADTLAGPWTAAGAALAGAGAELTFTHAVGSAPVRGYYRVRVQP